MISSVLIPYTVLVYSTIYTCIIYLTGEMSYVMHHRPVIVPAQTAVNIINNNDTNNRMNTNIIDLY